MTPEQMEAAKRALADQNSQEIRKRILLKQYRADQERAQRWRLPFRMIRKAEYPAGEIPPNDFFPHLSRVGKDANGKPYTIPDAKEITPERAVYFFTRHLAANMDNLTQYAPSDWTGESITADMAEWYLQQYTARIADFLEHPKQFDQQRHPLPEHPEQIYFLLGEDNDI